MSKKAGRKSLKDKRSRKAGRRSRRAGLKRGGLSRRVKRGGERLTRHTHLPVLDGAAFLGAPTNGWSD
jgi:hypothetical protein